MKDAEKIWDRVATLGGKGDNTSDGAHLTPDGHYRIYKGGKYFVKGRFAFNDNVYYADSNGYLLNGWLKLVKEGGDWNSKKASDYVWKYCFPDNYIRCELGYQVVDGVGHYFDHAYGGNLMFNKTYKVGSQNYYCDQYGVCGPTTFETSSTLAKNAGGVTVATSSTTMDGSYSFFPKFNSNAESAYMVDNFMTAEEHAKYLNWFYSPMDVASAATTSALESGETEILTDDSLSGETGEEFVIENYTAPGEDLLSDGE